MNQVTSSPHLLDHSSVTRIMLTVLVALLPGIAVQSWIYGWGVIVNTGIALIAALAAEALVLAMRGRRPLPVLADLSAVLTAVLLALALPPLTPWWIPVVGSVFAIVVAKQLYGGIGYNLFNPAMAGYAVLLIAFPLELNRWNLPVSMLEQPLTLAESIRFALFESLPERFTLDALTMATPLDQARTGLTMGRSLAELAADIDGVFGALRSEFINLAYLAGGLVLIQQRVIDWRIPSAMLGGLLSVSLLFWLVNPGTFAPPSFHLFAGATMLGAFFIATDPVTASSTPLGRILFGAGCGLLLYLIRSFGAYPDAIAFAVLLMNLAVPVIDHYTRPRVYGHGQDKP